MEVVKTIAAAREHVRAARASGLTIGLVPTMGALHEGHLSLMRRSRVECGFTVATVFVNPTQFAPHEDLAKYPRDLAGDARLCESAGVDLILAPPVEEVYRPGAATWIEVEGLSDRLEGASRPGHFRGVATVVAKLFNMVQPDRAYFGRKDYQQLQVIRQMARDLDFPVEVVPCETVREPDGLAMSSRNMYLTDFDREVALTLSRALDAGRASAGEGASAVRRAARDVLVSEPLCRVDYLALVHPTTLDDVPEWYSGEALLAVAARVGSTRLIDNVPLTLGAQTAGAAR